MMGLLRANLNARNPNERILADPIEGLWLLATVEGLGVVAGHIGYCFVVQRSIIA